ncbi:KAP family NTPase [Actinomycetospora endophytica]|uniref:KAP family NTPase n=2 Tax=Actinomycetospora endophytica TaxID=2291215 RepID=A0ABS8P984_9PSEU|nr:KAP family NTPase [Actinomycetospora endophytica]
MGKTSTARAWMESVADEFDQLVFVSASHRQSSEIAKEIALTLRLADASDDRGELEFVGLIGRALRKRRLLVVIDDLMARSELLEDLVKFGPSASLVVVTSRAGEQVAWPVEVEIIDVPPMTDHEVRQILVSQAVIPSEVHDAGMVDRLVALIGGSPFVASMVATLLLQVSASDLVQRLEREVDMGTSGRYIAGSILQQAYGSIDRKDQTALRRLSVADRPFDTYVVSVVCELTIEDAKEVLARLADSALVGRSDEQYSIHRLVGEFCLPLLEGDGIGEVLERTSLFEAALMRRDVHPKWLADSPADSDELNREALAALVASRLRDFSQMDAGSSFLIHVDGRWGSGKSTLLSLIEQELPDDFEVIRFDAWKNSSISPPWWGLLTTLRTTLVLDRAMLSRPILRVKEVLARARRGSSPYLLTSALLTIGIVGALLLFGSALFNLSGTESTLKSVGGVAAAIAAIWSGTVLFARFVFWDSARGAQRLENSHSNPMEEVSAHFDWLLSQFRNRPVVFIDDLDRCDEKFTVALLDSIQTLVKDGPANGRLHAAPYFIVAGDGAWIRTAYETVYEKFAGAIGESGRPLGYLFLAKLFQLTVQVPSLGSGVARDFLDRLLEVAPGSQHSPSNSDPEESRVRDRVMSSGSEKEVVNVLSRTSAVVRSRVAPIAIKKLADPDLARLTEHNLQKFSTLLEPTPRSVKSFVNFYSMLRATRTLEGVAIDGDTLAVWTVILMRWPSLAHALAEHPEFAAGLAHADASAVAGRLPDELRPLVESLEVQALLKFRGGLLTEDAIRACSGAPSDADPTQTFKQGDDATGSAHDGT